MNSNNTMTPLSPAAQAVLTAATQRLYCLDPEDVPLSASEHGSAIAAALRAAAEHVQPSKQNYDEASHELAAACLNGMAYAANELRCIAAELEGAND